MRKRNWVDDEGVFQETQTIEVYDNNPSFIVTYRNEEGEYFRVIVTKKDNPIGFRAKFPGDDWKPKKKRKKIS